MALNMNDGTNPPTGLEQLQVAVREAAEKLAAFEAGRDDSERAEGAVRTPGQLWAQLLDAPMPERMHMLEMAIRNTEGLRECFQQDHKGRIEDLRYQLTHHQERLSAVFGFDEPQNLHALTVATQALRNIMVAGIAERIEPVVEYALAEPELPEFRQPEGLAAEKAKVVASLKEAGIDLDSRCGYQWRRGDDCRPQGHSCVLLNPLHSQDHECEQCEVRLSHVEAEKLAETGQ